MKVSQLYIYPIKSLRPTSITEGILTPRGLQYDRRFMLLKVQPATDNSGSTTLKNMHVTRAPEMGLFQTDIEIPQGEDDRGKVIVSHHPPSQSSSAAPGSDAEVSSVNKLEIPLQPDVKNLKSFEVVMHQSPTTAYDMGAEYNEWFSACFGYPVVLAYMGDHWREVLGTLAPAKQKHRNGQWWQTWQDSLLSPSGLEKWIHPILIVSFFINAIYQTKSYIQNGMSPEAAKALLPAALAGVALVVYTITNKDDDNKQEHEDGISFADCAPYLVISETSVDDVSTRLPDGEEMDHTKFRPNIVVSGAETAFEEDFWTKLAVGSDRVSLLLTGNCVRCQSLNVDFATGRMGDGESGAVLKKLMKDRRVDSGAKFSPVFGRYSFLDHAGDGMSIRVGDEVVVQERGEERSAVDWPGLTN
ncbi:hypothetical protein NUU61_008832 [Penicillium alfredii]|uniref:MOSC domain-containing protein n=1 Tax=Penicillium alfredii TaxID=1506179 RepID=A0A9W9JWL4_9EURO|nr:uncharacterized protein NUU61_008832 [Penicillium alfredii]KAJ5084253.1 hypothetical protein NUU61_008832 [Penicillium alfredii]